MAVQRSRRYSALLLIVGMAVCAPAQVLKPVLTYTMKLPRDRGVMFGMAVSPQKDLLTLVPRVDGHWKLIRVKNWNKSQPIEDQLTIESFSKAEGHINLDPIHLFSSPDGKYLFAVISGWRDLPHHKIQWESVLTVIDFSKFQILTSRREIMPHQTVWSQLANGIILSNAFETLTDKQGAGEKRTYYLAIIGLPTLEPTMQCTAAYLYDSTFEITSEDTSGCSNLLAFAGINSITDSLRSGEPDAASDHRWSVTKRLGAMDEVELSPDGHFAFDIWEAHRDGVLGGIVTTAQGLELYSLDPDATLTKLRIDKRVNIDATFASLNRDYLLTVEDGTCLNVYLLPEQPTNTITKTVP